ncbi:MAG: polyphosphate polymerase domain-containing protein [Butyrivibrio sp.]|nr:polyphosphate polymerase domain-containing protein [Butyrivibrio sp.]
MGQLMYYRVEDKYIIYEDQIAYLKSCLEKVMQKDKNGSDEGYLIRSVYFDDMNNSALMENEGGFDLRSKFRIRSYDRDDSFIRLEEKSKRNGYTHKEMARIQKETVKELIKDSTSVYNAPRCAAVLLKEDSFLTKKLYCNMNSVLLHPVSIVEYERLAYTERGGNVRITFDMNIGASSNVERFFEGDIWSVPVLEKGAHVLEVKYDEFLPDYIRKIIDTGSLQKTAFSKYTLSRNIKNQIGEYL